MARVIKAGVGTARPARPATRVLAQADVKKVIEKELFLAKQEAEELLKRADVERREILTTGKRQAALAHEEAMTRGASEAFARAAEEALVAFRKRADRYAEAADDIRTLAVEIAKKLLGNDPDLGAKDVERILQAGLTQLRAKRHVRVQVSTGRRQDLVFERPNLMKAVDASPDLLVEDADDVREGFARVVTEVGGALCAEESALDAVALAVNVKETPRERGTQSGTGATHVGLMGPGDTGRRRLAAETGELPDAGVSVHDIDDDDDVDALSDLPQAAVDEDDDDDDLDATRALPARVAPPRQTPGAVVPRRNPIASAAPAANRDGRVPTGRVEARGRAATRVLAVDEREQLVQKAKTGGPRVDLGAEEEDDLDLDLFTDDRPQKRR
ncbi:MAG: hypothetical protein Q8O67_33765 [Deltaproteobacteria bacterium]|nr:hypothetical protein [Deltaproteobacteria bacterium]